jgi:hypothetical protein
MPRVEFTHQWMLECFEETFMKTSRWLALIAGALFTALETLVVVGGKLGAPQKPTSVAAVADVATGTHS